MLSRDEVEEANQVFQDSSQVVASENGKRQTDFEVLWDIASCSIQIALGYICMDFVIAITIHFISEAYPNPIAANGVGLAFIIVILFIQPFGLGINQQLNLYVSQALGANNQYLAVQKLNIALYIHILYFLPLSLGIYFLRNVFGYIILEDKQETIGHAWDYLQYLIVATFFAIQFECIKAYCIAHNVIHPFIVIHFISTTLLVVWCHILINLFGLGIHGAGYAIILTQMLNCSLLAIYLTNSSYKVLFNGFTFSCILMQQTTMFFDFVFSSYHMVMHLYADHLAFFVLTFLAANLGTISLNAQIALSNTSSVFFRICISLSIGLLTFVGKSVGSGNVRDAKRQSIAGAILFTLFAILYTLPLWIFRQEWANFYAVDKVEVQDLMITTLPYFIIACVVLDGFQTSLTGILKGLNQAPLVNSLTLIVYYVIGIPLISYFTFQWGLGLGLVGLWIGFGVANGILLISYILVMFFHVNWDNYQSSQIISSSVKCRYDKQHE